MSNPIRRAIWYLRVKRGLYISRRAERYIVEELEEDLFAYGFGDGTDEEIIGGIRWFLDKLNGGEIDISGSYHEHTLRRYEALKKELLHMLWLENQDAPDGDRNDDLPF